MEHSFFDKNPVEGADVYYLRYVLYVAGCFPQLKSMLTIVFSHDWSDDYCVNILSHIRESMAPHSRLLICEQVMNTTIGDPDLTSAPAPLPANYGFHARFSHCRDLTMMAAINGIERTPEEFKTILKSAGLALKQIWECRSQVSLLEAVRADARTA